jgi:uncharacterized cupin superfamily protein
MIIRRSAARQIDIPDCHGGKGTVACAEYLGDYAKSAPGVKFVHDDILPPGVSIGEHRHSGDEEVYVILEGRGTMTVDGIAMDVSGGDVCLTRSGHSHSLHNSGTEPLRLLVVGTNVGTGHEAAARG